VTKPGKIRTNIETANPNRIDPQNGLTLVQSCSSSLYPWPPAFFLGVYAADFTYVERAGDGASILTSVGFDPLWALLAPPAGGGGGAIIFGGI